MTRSVVVISLWLGSLLLSACGAKAGDACTGATYTCASEKQALECRDSVWRPLPCRGSAGCDESSGTVRCDLSGNAPGDACATGAEGRGLCRADGLAVLECRMGVLVQVKTCGTCATSNGLVSCTP